MDHEMIEYFEWLDTLRSTGGANMFGARPLLAEHFGLDRKSSSAIHAEWMRTFDGETPLEARAAKAADAIYRAEG